MIRRENGSILPLGIASIAVSCVFTLLLVELIGVQYQSLQNKQIADALALQVAGDLNRDAIAPVINLEYLPAVRSTLHDSATYMGLNPSKVSVKTVDGNTMQATVCTQWRSITGFQFGNLGEVCSSSKARAISTASG